MIFFILLDYLYTLSSHSKSLHFIPFLASKFAFKNVDKIKLPHLKKIFLAENLLDISFKPYSTYFVVYIDQIKRQLQNKVPYRENCLTVLFCQFTRFCMVQFFCSCTYYYNYNYFPDVGLYNPIWTQNNCCKFCINDDASLQSSHWAMKWFVTLQYYLFNDFINSFIILLFELWWEKLNSFVNLL